MHQQIRTAAATAAVVGFDAMTLQADLDIGAIVTGITAVGGAFIALAYVGWTKFIEGHQRWLEANKDTLLTQLRAAQAELRARAGMIEENTAEIAGLKQRLEERERFIVELHEEKDQLSMEMQELAITLLREKGCIVETTTTKVAVPPSSDAIPTLRAAIKGQADGQGKGAAD